MGEGYFEMSEFQKKKNAVLSTSIALAVLSTICMCMGISHICMYGAHCWYYACYTGDGIWGSICGVIGSGLGIAAGCMEDRSIFKALYIAHSTLSSIGICLSLCAMTMTACGLAWSFGYYNWSLWGMWIAEGVFLLGVFICSCVAACRIGCWCCIDDNLIEPLT